MTSFVDFLPRVESLRQDFPLLNRPLSSEDLPCDLVYFDNAATTQKPQSVLQSLSDYYQTANANIHRAIHSLGEESTRRYESARDKVCRFIGADSRDEIIFTKGATDSINLVAHSFAQLLQKGDEIITTVMEHHANLVPWQMVAKQYQLRLKFLPIDDQGVLLIDQLPKLWSNKVRLVAVTQLSNVLGTINPIKEIVSFAHQKGVPVLVDGAQSVAHMKVNVKELGCDFLAFSGHKMCGPTGIGVLYAKKQWLEKMPPYQGGGNMIRSVSLEGFECNFLPYKFEAGTPPIAGAIGLAAAIDYINYVDLNWSYRYEELLTEYAYQKIKEIPLIRFFGQAPEKAGILTFDLADIHSHDLSAFLDTKGIAIRAGHHCAHSLAKRLGVVSTARASFYFYNTPAEVDLLAQALREALQVLP